MAMGSSKVCFQRAKGWEDGEREASFRYETFLKLLLEARLAHSLFPTRLGASQEEELGLTRCIHECLLTTSSLIWSKAPTLVKRQLG